MRQLYTEVRDKVVWINADLIVLKNHVTQTDQQPAMRIAICPDSQPGPLSMCTDWNKTTVLPPSLQKW
jgi:hypothetical protein